MPDPAAAPGFPAHFAWGAATSAFQIEGALDAEGRGPSIWDLFCRQPGAIADGSDASVACDHYHRWRTDLDLMADLGLDAYRFSIAWPRVQPDGAGAWNAPGLDFYDRLVDGLLARGLQPHVTLHHWDLPQALQARGGWAARETVQCFVDYARGIQRRLGDRVASIATHNEPWVMAVLGHERGVFAPGLRARGTAMQVAHHLLLSHGLALQALRADGARAPLGIVLNMAPAQPVDDTPAAAARARLEEGHVVRWYLEPLLRGAYPRDVWDDLGADVPQVAPGDLAAIAAPLDFLGINYYSRMLVNADGVLPAVARPGGPPLTDMGWEVVPQAFTDLLSGLHRAYTLPPVLIAENGAAFADTLQDGRVHDAERVRYLADHIDALAQAMRAGVPVFGYMVWSLLDNFEWASGCAKRFGLVHVDYATQQRTLKDSAHWYRAFIARQRSARARPHGQEV